MLMLEFFVIINLRNIKFFINIFVKLFYLLYLKLNLDYINNLDLLKV